MSVRVLSTSIEMLPLRTRMPFRYGIATASAILHLMVRIEFEIDGRRVVGRAADHLAPKWFTKDPGTRYEDDAQDLRNAVAAACLFAEGISESDSAFYLWKKLYEAPRPFSPVPLVHSFACSFVERAAIDAACRATGQPFRADARISPLRSLIVRHTVGLSDPLTDGEILAGGRLDDGLPQSLEACVARYGLTHFKIKLSGDAARDVGRLRDIGSVVPRAVAFTLDGNENFADVDQFREFWERFCLDGSLTDLRAKILFVEQPLHRDAALSEQTSRALRAWTERPPMIIDESDDQLHAAEHALRAGYRGTSYKGCKGVWKGLANLFRMAEKDGILSAEDLTTIGPISLLQDLAVVASLGIPHVERNGHHYFRGLSMWPREVQRSVLAAHGDLYENAGEFVTLRIRGGRIDVGSVVDAPFGFASSVAQTLDQAQG